MAVSLVSLFSFLAFSHFARPNARTPARPRMPKLRTGSSGLCVTSQSGPRPLGGSPPLRNVTGEILGGATPRRCLASETTPGHGHLSQEIGAGARLIDAGPTHGVRGREKTGAKHGAKQATEQRAQGSARGWAKMTPIVWGLCHSQPETQAQLAESTRAAPGADLATLENANMASI